MSGDEHRPPDAPKADMPEADAPEADAPEPVVTEPVAPEVDGAVSPAPPEPAPPPEATEPSEPSRRRRGSRARRALPWLLTPLLLAAGAWAALTYLLSAPGSAGEAREFEVLPGWGAARVAAELEAEGLVRSGALFRYYLRYRELDKRVGEGLYDLRDDMAAREVADALASGGRPRTVLILIPEGWRATDAVRRLAANGLGSEESLAALVAEPGDLAPPYLPEGRGLEGYIFPATYEVPVRASEEEVLRLLLSRFDEELTKGVLNELEESGLSIDEWVTLASIVQAEAASHEEMPIIAGVFLNRLELGMPLQADPTVAYGLGKRMPELSALAGDLKRDTPWNTYMRAGLPETPISNPGRDALLAVLSPERTNERGVRWLYFLHGTDAGRPVFRPNTSLTAHERDVVVYLRNDGRR